MGLCEMVDLYERAIEILRNGHSNAVRDRWEKIPAVQSLPVVTRDTLWQLASIAVAG